MPTRSVTKPGSDDEQRRDREDRAFRQRPRRRPAGRQVGLHPCISVAIPCRRSRMLPATMPRSTSPSVGEHADRLADQDEGGDFRQDEAQDDEREREFA